MRSSIRSGHGTHFLQRQRLGYESEPVSSPQGERAGLARCTGGVHGTKACLRRPHCSKRCGRPIENLVERSALVVEREIGSSRVTCCEDGGAGAGTRRRRLGNAGRSSHRTYPRRTSGGWWRSLVALGRSAPGDKRDIRVSCSWLRVSQPGRRVRLLPSVPSRENARLTMATSQVMVPGNVDCIGHSCPGGPSDRARRGGSPSHRSATDKPLTRTDLSGSAGGAPNR